MTTVNPSARDAVGEYKWGFHDDEKPLFIAEKGLNEEVIRGMSAMKGEPAWMLENRLDAYRTFLELKDPAWADVFFLKLPHRVEALGYVLLLALLVWSIWERRIRKNLSATPERRFKDWNGMVRKNPTAMVCVHMLSGLKVVRV